MGRRLREESAPDSAPAPVWCVKLSGRFQPYDAAVTERIENVYQAGMEQEEEEEGVRG